MDYIAEGAAAMILAAVTLYLIWKIFAVDFVGFTDGHG